MLEPTHDTKQEATFYQELQEAQGLDLRDNRGKRHDLPLVLLGLVIGLLRGRDGNLSSIHRSMVNTHACLCEHLGLEEQTAVSRAQLPRILPQVGLAKFEELLFAHFGIRLDQEEKQWFSGDGKELRGSIEKGSKRGEVIVQLVRHEDRAVLGQSRYSGRKESEKVCLRELIEGQHAQKQKITADALHLDPTMTSLIEQARGTYIIGLKDNQKELSAEMLWHLRNTRPMATHETTDKGHGRLEKRSYACFDVSNGYFDERWRKSGLRTLFKVVRQRTQLKNGGFSEETAYYMSNLELSKMAAPQIEAIEYFEAIRNHWSVEVNNHIRDVSLAEDSLRTKKKPVTEMIAGMRTLAVEIIRKVKPKNIAAQLELFQDNFEQLMATLKDIRFL